MLTICHTATRSAGRQEACNYSATTFYSGQMAGCRRRRSPHWGAASRHQSGRLQGPQWRRSLKRWLFRHRNVRPRRRHGDELGSWAPLLAFASEGCNHKTWSTETLFLLCRRLSLLTFLLVPNSISEAHIITMGSQQRDDEINVLVTGFLVSVSPPSGHRTADSVAW